MTPTREELLAQIAEREAANEHDRAKLAALDAEREIAEIAEKVVAENHGGTPMVFAVAAIRQTLRRVPAWPREFLADGEALLIAFAEGTNWTPEKRAAYSRFASVIRRLKARMGAGSGAGCDSCNGLNTSCPEGCERDPKTGELLLGEQPKRVNIRATTVGEFDLAVSVWLIDPEDEDEEIDAIFDTDTVAEAERWCVRNRYEIVKKPGGSL